MAYTTIKKSSDYFNTVLYTGNGSTQSITGVGFQPDWVWLKHRNGSTNHNLFDVVRGVQKLVELNTGVEQTTTDKLSSFDSDGFTLGSNGGINGSGGTYASWNWLASNTTASNTNGSITSTVSANTTSGFSVVTYTGTGSNATVGHGLSSAPKMIIVKNRTASGFSWYTYHTSVGATKNLYLNNTDTPVTASDRWNDTEPTSSVFSVGTNGGTNGSGNNMLAYCFAEVKGFSKFGSYIGNGNADGSFIYLGFKPAMVIVKNITTATSWQLVDNKRNTFNITDKLLFPDLTDAEATSSGNAIDMLSNGFKTRGTGSQINTSNNTYIYMAFAEEPLVGDNPATAR